MNFVGQTKDTAVEKLGLYPSAAVFCKAGTYLLLATLIFKGSKFLKGAKKLNIRADERPGNGIIPKTAENVPLAPKSHLELEHLKI